MIKKTMKVVLFILLAVIGLAAAYVIFNLFDAGRDPGREYTAADLTPDDFSAANGYYLLWALAEPPDVDIESAAVRQKYRALFDPKMGAAANRKGWNHENYKGMFGTNFMQPRNRLSKKRDYSRIDDTPARPASDWMSLAVKHETSSSRSGNALGCAAAPLRQTAG